MELTRTIYRCAYVFKGHMGPVRDSKAFQTERDARTYAKGLKASGYLVIVWRERQVKTARRWETDLHDAITRPLDP